MARRTTKGSRTREAIISAAMNLASTVGFEGLSIGNLAKAMDMSKSGLFGHFNSKDRLQQAVLEAAREVFTDKVIRPAVQAPRGEPRIAALVDNWLSWAAVRTPPGGPG